VTAAAPLPGIPGVPVVRVRPAATAADWAAVRELCCRTGDAGEPIARARWPLFAELWVGPYQRLAPAWTYVAEADGGIVGYLTGCPDTAAFRRAQRLRVTLPLLLRIASGRFAWTADARRLVRLVFRRTRGVEDRLATVLPPGLLRSHPAHLHMNVAAGWRRQRIGTALLARYTADLAAAGIPGVHLICGAAPRAFYLREGFRELGAIEVTAGRSVHALGRRLGV
jgi:GNAT superfamily N-acetyltransferase